MMSTRTRTIEKNSTKSVSSAWSKAFTSNSEWPDKVNFGFKGLPIIE